MGSFVQSGRLGNALSAREAGLGDRRTLRASVSESNGDEQLALSRILRRTGTKAASRSERSSMSSSPSTPPFFITPGLSRQVTLQQRAHFLRFHPTPSEALLWSRLRGRRLGVQFRRQVIIGSYIVDFFAPVAGLVVEVDGDDYHAKRVSADRCRDEKLLRAGYAVLRLRASLVGRRLDDAVALVAEALAGR